MKISLYNLQAQKTGEITLPKTVFGLSPNPSLESLAIRVFLANQRSAYAKTKHRGEVAGTTKKMWSQKGTGRARHGSAKAPIFVGGGSAHGPRGDRNFKLKLSSRQTQLALRSLLSRFASEKSLIAVNNLSQLSPKTKEAVKLVDLLEKENKLLPQSRKVGVITRKSLPNLQRAFGNLPGFTLLPLQSLHPYHLANQNFLIFSPAAISFLK